MVFGEPRFTQAIDFVVKLTSLSQLERALSHLREGFFVDEIAAKNAYYQRRLFQVFDRTTHKKADLHIGEAVPGEMSRSQMAELFPGLILPCVSREDALLSKLLWIQKGSHKSRQDVVAMLLRKVPPINMVQVSKLAEELGVTPILKELQGEASQ